LFEAAIDDFGIELLAPSGGCLPASRYCPPSPNSVGPGATMSASGSPSLSANDLVLTAGPCPTGQPGVFFYGSARIELPFGNGHRCVGGDVFRLDSPVFVGPNGLAMRARDFGAPPAAAGPGRIDAWSSWNFQFWYRDPGAGFDLSDALGLRFCP
jgi:hypothetical protein